MRRLLESVMERRLLWIASDKVRLLIGERRLSLAHRRATLSTKWSVVAQQGVHDRSAIEAARDCLRDASPAHSVRGKAVDIILESSCAPAEAIDLGTQRMPGAIRRQVFQASVENSLGPLSGEWLVRGDDRVRHGRTVVFACDRTFVEALNGSTGTRLRIADVLPASVWALRQVDSMRRAADSGTRLVLPPADFLGWHIHIEPDRALCQFLVKGRASHAVLMPAVNTSMIQGSQWAMALQGWERRLGLPQGPNDWIVTTSDGNPTTCTATPSGTVYRIGVLPSLAAPPANAATAEDVPHPGFSSAATKGVVL